MLALSWPDGAGIVMPTKFLSISKKVLVGVEFEQRESASVSFWNSALHHGSLPSAARFRLKSANSRS